MSTTPTNELSALDWRRAFAEGKLDLMDTIGAHMQYVEHANESIQAFVSLGGKELNDQLDQLKAWRDSGQELGPLHGVPVGIKDIIDTEDFPTCYGSPIHEGRYAIADATVVRRLRQAGAVIVGKTATTEFATFYPAKTCNPHSPEHTPGGSSSGSAAAVAAGLVPVALGSQTNGSMIRPASFCGVYGFKPSFGLLPRTGVFDQSASLDQLGVFARNLEDLALVSQLIAGDDGSDRATQGVASHRFFDIAMQEPPVQPRFCFVKTPWWSQVDPDAQAAYEAFIELMGETVDLVELPAVVEKVIDWHATVNESELALALTSEYMHHRDGLSQAMQDRLEKANAITAKDYLIAKSRIDNVAVAFEEFFDRYDAILTPAALGTAPKGLASTGNPIMQTVWSFGGLPSVNLPLLRGDNGLPLGVQAVGSFRQDGRLLRSLRWFVQAFDQRSQSA
ncbi:MAG: amidase [Betaproteobacteria bacterium]|nr:amidase [Betaproteobacteria bacterium]